jgi:hypothetical protein
MSAASTEHHRADAALIRDAHRWRTRVASNLVLRNASLSAADLNRALQRIVGRLVFWRICRERGCVKMNGDCGADVRSAAHPLMLDESIADGILGGGFSSASPNEIAGAGAGILGKIYEESMGVRTTAEKKSGGAFYTPKFIVDGIVGSTLGKVLEDKTIRQAWEIKCVDPACGSGAFLMGAYQFLLDWYLDRLIQDGVEHYSAGESAALCRSENGAWRLTMRARKRILTDHIYGVDIDAQAVETTKLSLLLTLLEEARGQSQDTVEWPDLSANIQCGNALIGPDIYDRHRTRMDAPARLRINAFDWNAEFGSIMTGGGFDVVLGNPPWISLSGKFGNGSCGRVEIDYLKAKYNGNRTMPNMYEYFIAQSLNLLKAGGRLGFIVPDRLGFNAQFIALRQRLLSKTTLCELIYKIPFRSVSADTLVLVLLNRTPPDDWHVRISEHGKAVSSRLQRALLDTSGKTLDYFENPAIMALAARLAEHPRVLPLGDVFETTSGFGGQSALIRDRRQTEAEIPCLKGESIGRYEIKKQYWFDFRRENITGRTTDAAKLGARPKILLRKTGDTIVATYDASGIFPEQSLYFLFSGKSRMDGKYVLGLLNSTLMLTFYQAKLLTNKNSMAHVKKVDLDRIPIRAIDFNDPAERLLHDKMTELVERMLLLGASSGEATSPHERARIQREFAATDAAIDSVVYELYGLTCDEIELVKATRK